MDAVPERVSDPSDIGAKDSLSPVAPYRVINIGNSEPVQLLSFIEAIEHAGRPEGRQEFHGYAAR